MEKTDRRKEIDGAFYEALPMPVDPATDLFVQIGKLVGPALSEAKGLSLDAKVNLQMLGPMLAKLMMSADAAAVKAIYKKAFEYMTRDGVPLGSTYAGVFTGNLATMAKVLMHFLQVTYGDFFGLLSSDEPGAAQQ